MDGDNNIIGIESAVVDSEATINTAGYTFENFTFNDDVNVVESATFETVTFNGDNDVDVDGGETLTLVGDIDNDEDTDFIGDGSIDTSDATLENDLDNATAGYDSDDITLVFCKKKLHNVAAKTYIRLPAG